MLQHRQTGAETMPCIPEDVWSRTAIVGSNTMPPRDPDDDDDEDEDEEDNEQEDEDEEPPVVREPDE
jgi:hypothetical protein